MVTLAVTSDELVVRFSRWESLMVRREVYAAPMSRITHVRVLPGWTSEVLGFRIGLVVSGFLKLGTWTHPSGVRRLVAMRRGMPTLRVGLGRRAGEKEFDELLISSPEAYAVADALGAGSRA